MPPDANPSRRSMLQVLGVAPFRRYIIGSAISDTGTWMQVMAQAWVMSTLTDKALVLGLVNFAAGIPTIALTMIGGSAADRYDKRKILIATQVAQTVFALILGTLVWTGRIQIWHIILLAAGLGVSIAFEMPALSALVPELVKREQIATAVALDRSVFHGSRLVGPSVAGLLVAWYGAASAFFANAVSFFALIIALMTLPARVAGTAEEEEQRRSGFKEGLLYVRHDRTILSMIALIALTTIFVFPFLSVMLPLYVRNILKLGPDKMGMLMAISGTGSLFGSLGLLSVAREHRLRYMTCAVSVVAVALFSMSQARSFLLTAVAMGTLAVALSLNFGLAGTIVQERAPSPLRGRISAVFGLSFFGLMPIAGLLTTSLADLIGIPSALMIASILFGAGALVVMNLAGRTVCAGPVAEEPATNSELATKAVAAATAPSTVA
ncbi:MAG: MFS transporter [Verrucomicrobiota bacterium]|nr:MFS transporter [Verrucomicrobiota bacterium]